MKSYFPEKLINNFKQFNAFKPQIQKQHSEVFLGKGILKICCKFTGEHPYRSAISIKLQSKFTEITLWHRSSPVNLLHLFTKPFPKNTSGRLLLQKETIQLIGTAYCFTVSLLMATFNCAEWVIPFSCITRAMFESPATEKWLFWKF